MYKRTASRPSCSKRWPPSAIWPSIGTAFAQRWSEHGIESGRRAEGRAVPVTARSTPLKKAMHGSEFLGYETTRSRRRQGRRHHRQRSTRATRSTKSATSSRSSSCSTRRRSTARCGGQVGDTGEIVGARLPLRSDRHADRRRLHAAPRPSPRGPHASSATRSTARVDADAPRRASAAPTRPRTCCTTPCKSTWASTPSSKARRSTTTWLRFDFANPSAVGAEELAQIETEVNAQSSAGRAGRLRRRCRMAEARKPAR